MAGEQTPERVRQLITNSGLTQAEVADKVGLDASKLSKSLASVRRFTSLDLAKIADLFGVTVDWLLGSDPVTASMAARASTAPMTSADVAIQEAARLAQMRADLAFLGYEQSVPRFPLSALSRCVDQGRALAELAAGQAQARGVQLWSRRDLAEAVETAFGVDVRIITLPDGFDGLARHDDQCSLIVVGTSKYPARQRFTIAHELGHLLARDDQGLHVDTDTHDASRKREPSEMRANAFAAELLLPAQLLREENARASWSSESFAKLACRLWVSPSTLAWRLFNLNLIDRPLCDSFRAMTAREAAGLAGAYDAVAEWIGQASAPRIPVPLLRTTFQAYADGNATLRPFANLIGIDTDMVRQAMNDTREDSPLAS